MDNNSFYPGQIVVSLVTSLNTATVVEKNKEYEIQGTRKGCSHVPVLVDVGSPGPEHTGESRCNKCGTIFPGTWAPAKWFRPKDQLPSKEKKEDNQFKEVTFTKIKELVPASSEN